METIAVVAGIPVRVRESGVMSPAWTPEHRATVAALAGAVAVGAMRDADELAAKAVRSDTAKDAAQWSAAARNLAVVAGICTDKAQLLAGAPTARVERVDTAELTARLQRLLGVRMLEPADEPDERSAL